MRPINRSTVRGSLVLLILLPVSAYADEARIPIFKPTEITQPGHYIVTRDIYSPSESAITIRTNNVHLDLNGYTLSSGAFAIVTIDPSTDREGLIIRNGRIINGIHGIHFTNLVGVGRLRARFEDLEVGHLSGAGIVIADARSIDIIRCHVHDTVSDGISLQGFTGDRLVKGTILRNKVERVGKSGMFLRGLRSGQVRENIVLDFGSDSEESSGINVSPGPGIGGNLIQGNTVSSLPGGTNDAGIRVTSSHNLIMNNIVMNNSLEGLDIRSEQNRIQGNVASANGRDGIRIGSAFSTPVNNHIEENSASGNTVCGINFFSGSSHSYRGNILLGNPTPVCGVTAGIDAGGNLF